ncbi:MAG: energy transducer TonB, partial [Bacteroidota bacterium]
ASFTSQKLYLINPVRRKYTLKVPTPPPASEPKAPAPDSPVVQTPPTSSPKPAAKPVFKPKIK